MAETNPAVIWWSAPSPGWRLCRRRRDSPRRKPRSCDGGCLPEPGSGCSLLVRSPDRTGVHSQQCRTGQTGDQGDVQLFRGPALDLLTLGPWVRFICIRSLQKPSGSVGAPPVDLNDSDNLKAQADLDSMSMDMRSSGAILRILNLIAMADGHLSPEEEHLLDSLAQQYKLQARIVSWEQELADPSSITALASIVATEHHGLLLRTACMVAGIARASRDDHYIGAEEDALIRELELALSLTEAERTTARQQAMAELERQPSLWQVLYACFGSQFERPLLA